MNVNETVVTALQSLDVPVVFQYYAGNEDTYITFFSYLDQPEQHADDTEVSIGHYVQVDVWSKSDYTDLVSEVQERLKEVGFRRINGYDLYEEDLKIYHKTMRYVGETWVSPTCIC